MEGFYMIFLIPGFIFLFMGLVFLFVMRKVTKPEKDWKTTTGIKHEKTSKIQQSPGFAIGSTVEILYDPEDPQQAVINSFIQKGTLLNIIGKILTLVSVILLIIAFFIFLFN